ncbi:MAG TPA: DNA-processing protein DprA [Candidatus Saccharimonadales bacterium]|nr:DNA-processing protein DprA [Candidatus Saccharimonadales bacterium]
MRILRIDRNAKEYPRELEELYNPPGRLNVIGGVTQLINMPRLGIVGSRKVSGYGRTVTQELAASLARAGVCIVSGLAYGVDSLAHKATLQAKGKTIAVLPGGLRAIYPAGHRSLAKDILNNDGGLISEYDDDFRPRRESFIQRNRIIAGLSDALLVTEAAEKSGSLHTANFALEAGKPVLAVPGNINSPTSRGTNNLLKAGAIMVTDEQDILDVLKIPAQNPEQLDIYGDNEQESAILDLLRSGVHGGDELLRLSKMEVNLFQQTLSMLEIKGFIHPLGNNDWRLK